MRKLPEISRSKSDPSRCQVTTPKSRQRKRSEKLAYDYVDSSVRMPVGARQRARKLIRQSLRPKVEAKRIVQQFQKRAAYVDIDGRPDLSDVAEHRVRLIRRDGIDDTQGLVPHLERLVAEGCTKAKFEKLAGIILALPPALPKKVRDAEKRWRLVDRGLLLRPTKPK